MINFSDEAKRLSRRLKVKATIKKPTLPSSEKCSGERTSISLLSQTCIK
jgi:hypothetical protein